MNATFSLGRIFGISVGINWSWLIVFALMLWSLADAVFPSQNPGLSDGTYFGMALVAAALFFISLLLHELGHAIQARREGMEIDGIVLWLFGGVASFKGAFPSAGAEFRIAIAGPLVTLVLGVFFVGVAVATSVSQAVDGVAAWLGYINILLLLFNLLPALPLDGGRVLRSALWAARDDFRWATSVAANIGRGFGFLMIAGGLFLFVVEGAFSGAWLAFLGWFLLGAASAEARYVVTRDALRGLRVGDLMVTQPVTADADDTLGQFMDETAGRSRFTTYPVVDDGQRRRPPALPLRRADAARRVGHDDGARLRAPAGRGDHARGERAGNGGAGRAQRGRPPPRPRGRGRPPARPALDHRHRPRALRAPAPSRAPVRA